MAEEDIIRRVLLTAALAGGKQVDRVEAQSVTLPARRQAGLHLHPCPVVGLVTQGRILFQVEGEEGRVLQAGDAFLEPAGARVPHFDALDETATFVAFYLLGADDRELIRML